MRLLKFDLKGKTSFCKRTDQNGINVFSYRIVTHQVIKGMLGAIIGLKGYDNLFPEKTQGEMLEFNRVFQSLKIGVVPKFEENGLILAYNHRVNSTLFGNLSNKIKSMKQGDGLAIREQWVANVAYTIYLDITNLDEEYAQKLEHYLANGMAVYLPYIGRREHYAHISNFEVIEVNACEERWFICSSTLPLSDVEQAKRVSKYSDDIINLTELSPVDLINFYHVYEELLYTNQQVYLKEKELKGSYYQIPDGVVCLYGAEEVDVKCSS